MYSGRKYGDSLKSDTVKKGMVVSLDNVLITKQFDSANWTERLKDPKKDYFFKILYTVDSLQDSLRISEVNAKLTEALQKQDLDAPFHVERFDSTTKDRKENEVDGGFRQASYLSVSCWEIHFPT